MGSRRAFLAGLGAVPLLGGRRRRKPAEQVMMWEREKCGRCGRDVMFLPGQRRNRCRWCGRRVRHDVE